VVPAGKRVDRVVLREARHAPAPDGGADEVQRPRAGRAEELPEQVAVESREGEPLRAARRGGDDVDVVGAEAAVAHERDGVGARAEREGRWHARKVATRPETAAWRGAYGLT